MSDEDSKSSSGSEMNTAKPEEDSLNTVQQMIVDQQQHLISHYQYDTNITSVENEDKGCDIVQSIDKEKSEPRIINKQHSILNDIKKEIEKDDYSISNDVNSQNTVTSKEEAVDSQQISRSLKNDPPLALGMTLSNSREIPKQNHLEDTLIGRETPSRGSITSQDQADESIQLEIMPSDNGLSAMEVSTPAMPYSSQEAWRSLEQDLEEYFSNIEIHNVSAFHDAATAQLIAPPGALNDSATGSAYGRLWRGSSLGQVPRPAQSRSQVVRERVDEVDVDDRKPPASSPNDDVA